MHNSLLNKPSKEIKEEVNSLKEIPIKITHGYSRDHRPDLKQFILNMIVSGDGDIPIFGGNRRLLQRGATKSNL